jgi:hypothetical protein
MLHFQQIAKSLIGLLIKEEKENIDYIERVDKPFQCAHIIRSATTYNVHCIKCCNYGVKLSIKSSN